MNVDGILVGMLAFLLIGIFHPIVIWSEYYFSSRCWPVFFVVGVSLLAASVYTDGVLLSIAFGITGFSCFWSILELKEQEKRVEKGWFPKRARKSRVDKPYARSFLRF